MAMALLAWPSRDEALAWYDCDDYLPYRAQRHAASDTTVVSVPRRPGTAIARSAAAGREAARR